MELLQAAVDDKIHNAALEEASLKYIALSTTHDEAEESECVDSDIDNYMQIPGLGRVQEQPTMPTLPEGEEEEAEASKEEVEASIQEQGPDVEMATEGEAVTTGAAQQEPETEPAAASLQIGEGSSLLRAADVDLGAQSASADSPQTQVAEQPGTTPAEEQLVTPTGPQPKTPTGPSTFVQHKSPPPSGPQLKTPTGAQPKTPKEPSPIIATTMPVAVDGGVTPLEGSTLLGVYDEGCIC